MRKNILLVDDDRVFNFLSEKVISRLGVARNIQTASNGMEALDIINRDGGDAVQAPDVIFLDLNMPVMNGFQFLERFNNLNLTDRDKIVIIVVSSSADPRDLDKIKALGIRYYINKPVTEEAVRNILQEAFNTSI
jgi:CheY-like chemotaxis protein